MNKTKFSNFLLNILFPCFVLSGIVGIISGTVVFFFKYIAHLLSNQSMDIYFFVKENLIYVPLVLLLLSVFAIISYHIVRLCKCAKGGGIPTAVGILRGQITFKWFPNLIGTIISAFISYFSGLSLGEEGQSVQIGTCIGEGVSKITGKKQKAWHRYVMTGGAASGFAVATGAPVSGVFFALEEAHKRLSPMIIMVTLSSVFFSYFTSKLWSFITGISPSNILLDTSNITLPLKDIWIVLIIGIIVGFFACGVTKVFKLMNHYWSEKFYKCPLYVKFIIAFLISGIIGIIIPYSIGGGMQLINLAIQRKVIFTSLLLLLFVKTLLALFLNNTGVTGGMFIPTLCQGTLLGAILAEIFIKLGISSEYYLIIVMISMISYLASIQRVPMTAIIFSMELFGSVNNILFVILGVFLSFMIIEMFNNRSLNDISLEQRLKVDNKDRVKVFKETTMVVQSNSFAIGKTIRDIFWPTDCQVLSLIYNTKQAAIKDGEKHIHEGDLVKLRYARYLDDKDETLATLKSILGNQEMNEMDTTS